ncbi:MAG TPA: VWA domain-containing protein [Candidatus Polarisedimenticolia bacterium]|jgi:Ca-activated chloride channel family protein|nr:VWA domain-containing protein [Candidatus Polarisedimenticolia bacterium]
MRFAAPEYLWLLFGLPVLALAFVLSFRRRRRALEALGELRLVRRLTASASTERRIIKAVLVGGAVLFLVLALARPQWGAKLETVTRRGVDVIIAVDTSTSMLAEDVKPSRMAQARAAVASFVDLLRGDRIGLVAFAGTAYVACPLTLDYTAAAMFVEVLDTDLIPIQGTAIAAAIRAATSAFRQGERRHKVLVLLTDGEDHEGDVMAAARDAGAEGITIFTIGVGSSRGEPIPLRNERGDIIGYKEDRKHRKVTSRLGESDLEAIALQTGGKYFRSTPDGIELQRVYEEISRMDQRTMSGRMMSVYEERYQIPLLAALILLAIEAALLDRRRNAAAPEQRAPEKEAA